MEKYTKPTAIDLGELFAAVSGACASGSIAGSAGMLCSSGANAGIPGKCDQGSAYVPASCSTGAVPTTGTGCGIGNNPKGGACAIGSKP